MERKKGQVRKVKIPLNGKKEITKENLEKINTLEVISLKQHLYFKNINVIDFQIRENKLTLFVME